MNYKHLLLVMAMTVMSVSVFGQTLHPKQKANGKFGYVDSTGNWIIKPKFSAVAEFVDYEGLSYALIEKKGKIGLINKAGDIVIKPQYKKTHFIPELSTYVFFRYDENIDVALDCFACNEGLKFKVENFHVCQKEWYTVTSFTVKSQYADDETPLALGLLTAVTGIPFGYNAQSMSKQALLDNYLQKNFGLGKNKDFTKYTSVAISLNAPITVDSKETRKLFFNSNEHKIFYSNNVIACAEERPKEHWNKDNYGNGYLIKDGDVVMHDSVVDCFETSHSSDGITTVCIGDFKACILNEHIYQQFEGIRKKWYKELETGKYGFELPMHPNEQGLFIYDSIAIVEGGYFANGSYDEEDYIFLVKVDNTWKVKIKEGKDNECYTFKNPSQAVPSVFCSFPREYVFEDNGKYGLFFRNATDIEIKMEGCDNIQPRRNISEKRILYQVHKDGKEFLYQPSHYSFDPFEDRLAEIPSGFNTVGCDKDLTTLIIKDKRTGKQGLSRNGKVIASQYDSIMIKESDTEEWLAEKNNIRYLLNPKTGKIIADGTRYDAYRTTGNGTVYTVLRNGKIGLIDAETGRVIVPAKYGGYFCYGRGFHVMVNEFDNKFAFTVYDSKGNVKSFKTFIITDEYGMAYYLDSWCGPMDLIMENGRAAEERGHYPSLLKVDE